MREFIRPVAVTFSIACLAASLAALPTQSALAQGKQMAPQGKQQMAPPPAAGQPAAVKQIALTDKQVEGVISADKDIYPLMQKMPKSGKPDSKLAAQLDAAAKKNGFASYDEYTTVVDNIGLVMAGIDSTSKKYVGNAAVAKAQIAEVQADKKMSAKDKKAALDDLNQAAKAPDPTIENKGNIDLVVKNYDKLAPIMGGDQN
ncbi:MAG TPA: hypothetical protein VFL62_14380 [Bradyrhizobium sp.]|uniref:hypothetical protein n=1 Tax=Bradyrhizobium sp. TaxID=376 RepID=UPI002D80C64E|nr:hypothetical protein [Bradyrhizobium sp.]HET7887412.1 hypothetical protein [Bradyrhizobium sp.]